MFSTNGVQYLLLYKRPSVQSPPVNSLKKTFPSLVWGNLKHLQNLPSWLSGKESAKQKTGVQSLGQEDPPEKGMATHFSILAWRIPRTEEPGGLRSMGSRRVRCD